MDVASLVSHVGFPIAACIIMGSFIKSMVADTKIREESLMHVNKTLLETNQQLCSNINVISSKICAIDSRIDRIEGVLIVHSLPRGANKVGD